MPISKTQRLLEYYERSKCTEFPENVEAAIEKDYPKNHALYTDAIFAEMKLILLLCPEIDPEKLIESAKKTSGKTT